MVRTLRPPRPKVKQQLRVDSPESVVSGDGQRGGDEAARQLRLFAGAPRHRDPGGLDALKADRSQPREGRADRADRGFALAGDREPREDRGKRLLEGVHTSPGPQRLAAELLKRPKRT